jgi:hypothetical protein
VIERIKKAMSPPVTQEWVDMVAGAREVRAQEVEEARGPVAAEKHRAITRRIVSRMGRRGIIPSDRTT